MTPSAAVPESVPFPAAAQHVLQRTRRGAAPGGDHTVGPVDQARAQGLAMHQQPGVIFDQARAPAQLRLLGRERQVDGPEPGSDRVPGSPPTRARVPSFSGPQCRRVRMSSTIPTHAPEPSRVTQNSGWSWTRGLRLRKCLHQARCQSCSAKGKVLPVSR